MSPINDLPTVRLYYDGDCPFCSRFARYTALKRTIDLELIDARQAPEDVARLSAGGYDIDAGLLLTIGKTVLQGADALAWLDGRLVVTALPDRGWHWLVRQPRLLRCLYPSLNTLRKFLLLLLGRNTTIG